MTEKTRTEKILLVDDDPLILEGYRRSLGREFPMETALGGEDALKLALDTGPYAVVISDMKMPGMDGLQLLTRIKAVSPETTRIMLTGNTEMETAINAINLPLPQQTLQQGLDGENPHCGVGTIPPGYSGKAAPGTNPNVQHSSSYGSTQPGEPRRLWPRRACPPLYPLCCNRDEAGEPLAV
jgi:CheY-like chemotaxis protein